MGAALRLACQVCRHIAGFVSDLLTFNRGNIGAIIALLCGIWRRSQVGDGRCFQFLTFLETKKGPFLGPLKFVQF